MIFLILLLGLVLRFISLNQSLWIDEATTMNVARNFSFADIVSKFAPGDFHPPLYYLFMKAWVSIFGSSGIVGRLPSIIFGIATIYVVYLVGKRIVNRETGLVVALLLATAGLHIYYSQEARMYSLTALLVAITVYVFTKVLHEKSRVEDWILLSITIGILGMTDYVALLILPVFWTSGLIYRKNFSWFKRLLESHIILGFFGLVWLPIFLRQFNSGLSVSPTSAWAQSLGIFSLKEILLIPIKFMIGRVSFDKNIYIFVVGTLTTIFGYLIFKSKKEVVKLKLVWLWLVVPVGLGILISMKIPILNYFRFLFVLPALYLILASGLETIKNERMRNAFLIILVGLNLFFSGIYLFNKKYWREDWRSAVSFVGARTVIFPAKSQREAYLYYNPSSKIVEPNDLSKNDKQSLSLRGKEIFLIRYAQTISDPEDSTRKKIEDLGYKKQQEVDFNGVVVWRYSSN